MMNSLHVAVFATIYPQLDIVAPSIAIARTNWVQKKEKINSSRVSTDGAIVQSQEIGIGITRYLM